MPIQLFNSFQTLLSNSSTNGTTNGTIHTGGGIVFPPGTSIMSNVLSMSALISFLASCFTLGCCIYLKLYRKSSKRYIMYTLISDAILSLSYMGRFADWDSVPRQGFWCQWSGFLLVVGANSLTLWISATATWLLFLFFSEKPGIKFEMVFLVLWPLVTVLPAGVPYAIYQGITAYGPSPTGQCFLSQADLIIYIVIMWVGLLLLYIIISYTVLAGYIYYISLKVKDSIKDKARTQQVMTLAVSPILYLLLYLWIIISRLVPLSSAVTPLGLLRFAVAITVWIGFVNSIWFGYSRSIYTQVYQKIFGEERRSSQSLEVRKGSASGSGSKNNKDNNETTANNNNNNGVDGINYQAAVG